MKIKVSGHQQPPDSDGALERRMGDVGMGLVRDSVARLRNAAQMEGEAAAHRMQGVDEQVVLALVEIGKKKKR
jgi:hypothetical protein